MAKVSGPLFSIGASGTIADLLTFNPSQQATVVRLRPAHYPPPTTPQQIIRQRMKDAATAWATLTPTERAEWALIAANSGKLPFAKYLIEWNAQSSTLANPPNIPYQ